MTNPWEIKSDDKRTEDSLPTFIIFCEDQICEPIYFKYFETTKIKVNPIGNKKSKIENVTNALCHCRENDLMHNDNGVEFLNAGDIHVWCVFDMDKGAEEDDEANNANFDLAVDGAVAKGFNVAWSNDSFELWILLHFEDVDVKDDDFKSREKYYERLTEIFRNLPNPNEKLSRAKTHASFGYKSDLKRERNFRNIVRPELEKRITSAINRARKIEKVYSDADQNHHQKSPLTLAHLLVEELINKGGKEIN